MSHTPGPWVVAGREIHDRATEFDAQGARIGSTPNSIAEIHLMPFGNQEANARLIAAAPDLLNALENCLGDLRHYVATHGPGPDVRLAGAVAAIAKARDVTRKG